MHDLTLKHHVTRFGGVLGQGGRKEASDYADLLKVIGRGLVGSAELVS